MKKILHKSLLLSFMLVSGSVFSQDAYFTEFFDDAAAGQLTGTTANAPTTPTTYTLTSGAWTFYYAVRTGSGCTPTAVNPTSPKAVRILKNNATTPAGLNPPAYMNSPTLSTYGIGTVTWKNVKTAASPSETASSVSIYKSTNGGTSWVLVEKVPTTATTCVDYVVAINDPLANKIRFANESASDQDLDNVTITSFTTILPVKFSNFNALETSGKVKLNWDMATELNTANYVVERSSNGVTFTSAGVLEATQSKGYSFIDQSPVNGTNYYRIKGVDKDGAVMYSSILRVNVGSTKALAFTIAPNPVRGRQVNLQVANLTKGTYVINVFNAAGQQVLSRSIGHTGGSATYQLDLPASAKSGIYNLQMKDGETVLNKKLVIE